MTYLGRLNDLSTPTKPRYRLAEKIGKLTRPQPPPQLFPLIPQKNHSKIWRIEIFFIFANVKKIILT
jgi:hypothetical protein